MTGFLAWLATSAGKAAAKWGALVAVIAGILWRVHAAGRQAEKVDRAERDLEVEGIRRKVDDDVAKMSDRARRDELAHWVRHDG